MNFVESDYLRQNLTSFLLNYKLYNKILIKLRTFLKKMPHGIGYNFFKDIGYNFDTLNMYATQLTLYQQ